MRFIRDIFADARQAQRPVISFEFFPTKTPEGERTLLEKTIPALGQLNPDFCSVTYGAGGSTRERTARCRPIQPRRGSPRWRTCVRQRPARRHRQRARQRAPSASRHPALRGDPPGCIGDFQKTEGGFDTGTSSSASSRRWRILDRRRGISRRAHRADLRQYSTGTLKHKIDQAPTSSSHNCFSAPRHLSSGTTWRRSASRASVPGICRFERRQITIAPCAAQRPSLRVGARQRGDNRSGRAFRLESRRANARAVARGAPGLHFYTSQIASTCRSGKSEPVTSR